MLDYGKLGGLVSLVIVLTAGSQNSIWNAGSAEDYSTVTAPIKEPIISTMAIDQSADTTKALFRPDPEEAGITAYQLWQLHKRKLQLRQEYLEYWEGTKRSTGTGRPVDAIIAPCAPYAAPPHGTNWYVGVLNFAPVVFNLCAGMLVIRWFGTVWTMRHVSCP